MTAELTPGQCELRQSLIAGSPPQAGSAGESARHSHRSMTEDLGRLTSRAAIRSAVRTKFVTSSR